MPQSFPIIVNALRAAAEPTRLRLLALLTHGELTVGEICSVLGQSQPRISRHLKVLCDAGLLDRFREEHWVYYRVPLTGSGHELVAQLSGLILSGDPVLQLDHRRMAKVLAERATETQATAAPLSTDVSQVSGAIESAIDMNAALVELDGVLKAELGHTPLGELLDVATGSGRILRTLASQATHAVGIDISTEALRFARKQTYGAGLGHCVFRRADMYKLPFANGSFDTVTLERVLASATRVEGVLKEAARVLRAGGRLCIVEDFELLADTVGANPLAVLREWFKQAGLACERLRPLDAHGVHLIIALGRAPIAISTSTSMPTPQLINAA